MMEHSSVTLLEQLQRILPDGMQVPEPLAMLFAWIEDNGLFAEENGQRVGYLYPPTLLQAGWTDTERPGGTDIAFFAQGNAELQNWLGSDCEQALNRLCVFARTGADGSMAALWLDDAGEQKVVHLGSGSGSTMVCVLAQDAVDFLRLLAIGYDEICWDEFFDRPPNSDLERQGLFVHPNSVFQDWVRDTFSVSIPATGNEVVTYRSDMGKQPSEDPFQVWVAANSG